MKKIITILLSLLATINVCAETPYKFGMLSDSKEMAYNIKVGWNLGNSLDAYGNWTSDAETSWGNPKTTQAMIDAVKAAGFNAVRIPVRWYPHFTYSGGVVTIDASWLTRVKEVIGYCLNDGMYVIMNTHHELWLENHATYADSATVFAEERALWKTIANAFADYDESLMFAGTNEVHIDGVWSECTAENATVQNKFNQIFVNAVRATGGKNIYRNLIVQTYACNDSWGINHFIVPKDATPNRLMVEMHGYEPYNYAMNPKEPYKYWGAAYSSYGIESWSQETYLNNLFSNMEKTFLNKGYPVILGECGAIRHTSPTTAMNNSRAYYLKTFVSKAKLHGVVPFFWDNNNTATGEESYGLFNRKNNMSPVDDFSINAIMEGAATNYPYTTDIKTVKSDKCNGNVYSCNGMMVKKDATSLEGLPHGLYIMKGKKYAVK
jgi:endoglucanase